MTPAVPNRSRVAARSLVEGLRCRECAKEYPQGPQHVCEYCFGPLEVAYDYPAIAKALTRETIAARPMTMWRFAELLPLDRPPTVGLHSGGTPLAKTQRLARKLGVRELWVKNDAVCCPTLSFKDRVVSVALSKARELDISTVACASTGNLANAVAAHSSAAGLLAYVLIPRDLEASKVLGTTVFGAKVVAIDGTYDDVNRLCSEIAGQYGWGFVNVNLRPYYAEGSKSYGFEIAEQLGWRLPDHIVVPMASGSLLTKIEKAFGELGKIGLIEPTPVRYHGAQASGCSPIAEAVRQGRDSIKPVKQPKTIAKSLAIGNPADGYYAARAIRNSGGDAAAVSDEAIVHAIRLLAETEGIFTETAGGVTLASTIDLIERGKIPRDATIVVCITGNGLKTTEALAGQLAPPPVIRPTLREFEELVRR